MKLLQKNKKFRFTGKNCNTKCKNERDKSGAKYCSAPKAIKKSFEIC